MSSLSLSTADRPPEDPAQSTEFHCNLLAILNNDARDRHGWKGSTIEDYGKIGGIAFLQIVQGDERFASIEDLRTFREAQRSAREDVQQPKQGSLI